MYPILDPLLAEQAASATAADNDAEVLLPIRTLEIANNGKGFVDLLGQLGPCPAISDADFRSRFAELSVLGDDHAICVIEDTIAGRIVSTGSVFAEKKFLRGCCKVGHIEDVVVDGAVRGLYLGQRIVRYLAKHARAAGCYRVILDCTAELRGYYEKCGFAEKNLQMAMCFHD